MGTAFDDVMIAVTAAEMRKALGLRPWPLFEAQAQENFGRYVAAGGYPGAWALGRRTGRSTRGALAALAECRVRGLCAVHVVGDRTILRLVKDMTRALGLPIAVLDGDPERLRGYHGHVLFHVDHHAATRR